MNQSNVATKSRPELAPIRSNIEEAKRDLTDHGMTRFLGATTEDEIDAARARVIEQAAGEDAYGCGYHDSGFGSVHEPGGANQRVWNLVNKGEIFRRLMVNPVVLTLMRHVLGEDILLSNHIANIAHKGGLMGKLHGDQVPIETPFPLMANCIWMLHDFTEEKGATRVVPGSHRLAQHPPAEAFETVPAIGPKGTIMIFEGRLWHATGANLTDEPRYALLTAYSRAVVRQQENFTISVAPEVLEACSEEQLTLLGFRTMRGRLGSVDGSDAGTLNLRPKAFSRELRP
ncbi:phytanoyl-CoA dioxygenase family protein [Bradyrhizobium retamae]|uniref:Phytanoyl-CoA dioxygenase n=1 Tax=Bradyrhizobium retamae TaxID=1300035 RepID=A0A0R3NAM7_9BRAD|nr:phytanoyl-CoA dioxygenase family protein [Bradyrhizobium retamae]KRR29185.1 hypothetical protein CQ13_38825 [Bradyrhizobium retamae]